TFEKDALRSQLIDRRRGSGFVAEAAKVICSQGINRDQQDIPTGISWNRITESALSPRLLDYCSQQNQEEKAPNLTLAHCRQHVTFPASKCRNEHICYCRSPHRARPVYWGSESAAGYASRLEQPSSRSNI